MTTNTLPKLVAFAAAAARSGKSTAADVLVKEYGYTRVKFSGVLKAMLREFLKPLVSEDHLEELVEGGNKDCILTALGLTPRNLLLSLGTLWGRKLVQENIWVLLVRHQIEKIVAGGGRVVIDDLRFPNEFKAIRDAHGKVFFIYRPSVTPSVPMEAEGLIKHQDCDCAYENSTTIENLQWWVRMAVEGRYKRIDKEDNGCPTQMETSTKGKSSKRAKKPSSKTSF